MYVLCMKFHFYLFAIIIVASLFFIGTGITGFVVAEEAVSAAENYGSMLFGFFLFFSAVAMLYVQAYHYKNPRY